MGTQEEIERLRLEADTIMTRYEHVSEVLAQAHEESGEHWETGELSVTLDTPAGESITVTLDFEADPVANAQSRYDRASELAAARDRRAQVDEQVAALLADAVAYLICYHLEYVDGDYPKSIARHLDARREHVDRLCQELVETGVLERIESGTVKQRNVKAKQADEVRQHHTYYRLSRQGDHLLRFLAEVDGQVNVVRHLPDAAAMLRWVRAAGPAETRVIAEEMGLAFSETRHLCRTLRQVGLVREAGGGSETEYLARACAEGVLEALGE